jgi:hypothetical protein
MASRGSAAHLVEGVVDAARIDAQYRHGQWARRL